MTLAEHPISLQPTAGHFTMGGVGWDFYERVLEELDNRPIRVTFYEGQIEIMAPLPIHEVIKKDIAQLIETMLVERGIDYSFGGATTFKIAKESGLEPDECYYFGVGRDVDPTAVPVLAVEIEITRRVLPRLPIYAALGVPEIWRWSEAGIEVLLLNSGQYRVASASVAFAFLPMAGFEAYVRRMLVERRVQVVREFRTWVARLS